MGDHIPDCDREQLLQWLAETVDDNESVLGIKDEQETDQWKHITPAFWRVKKNEDSLALSKILIDGSIIFFCKTFKKYKKNYKYYFSQ